METVWDSKTGCDIYSASDKGRNVITTGKATIQQARDRACRRAAQGGNIPLTAYLKRFEAWVRGGLKGVPIDSIEEIKDEIRVAAEKELPRHKATPVRMTRKQKLSELNVG